LPNRWSRQADIASCWHPRHEPRETAAANPMTHCQTGQMQPSQRHGRARRGQLGPAQRTRRGRELGQYLPMMKRMRMRMTRPMMGQRWTRKGRRKKRRKRWKQPWHQQRWRRKRTMTMTKSTSEYGCLLHSDCAPSDGAKQRVRWSHREFLETWSAKCVPWLRFAPVHTHTHTYTHAHTCTHAGRDQIQCDSHDTKLNVDINFM
jgi:hypothetical protein